LIVNYQNGPTVVKNVVQEIKPELLKLKDKMGAEIVLEFSSKAAI
jgi:hypothetical protein